MRVSPMISCRTLLAASPIACNSQRAATRLPNEFSKKLGNRAHAIALHFMYYNFGRIHKSLRMTPAMAAGVSDYVWLLEEIAALPSK